MLINYEDFMVSLNLLDTVIKHKIPPANKDALGQAIHEEAIRNLSMGVDMARSAAKELAYSNPNRAHWIEDNDEEGIHCSYCGEDFCYLAGTPEEFRFCPHCGCEMEGIKRYGDRTDL